MLRVSHLPPLTDQHRAALAIAPGEAVAFTYGVLRRGFAENDERWVRRIYALNRLYCLMGRWRGAVPFRSRPEWLLLTEAERTAIESETARETRRAMVRSAYARVHMLAADDAADPARMVADIRLGTPLTPDALWAALESLHLTRAEFSALLELNDPTLRGYERGEPIPRSVAIIVKLMLCGKATAADLASL